MECERGEMRDLLPDLVHERIGATDRERVMAHVARCAPCATEVALLRRLRVAMHRSRAVDAPRIAAGTVAEMRRALVNPVGTGSRSRSWRWLTAAAAVLLVAGGLAVMSGSEREAVALELPLDAHLAVASDAELEAALETLDTLEATFAPEPAGALTGPLSGGTE